MYEPQSMDRFLHHLMYGLEYLHWIGALLVVLGMTVLPWSNLPLRMMGCTDALLPSIYSVGLNVTVERSQSLIQAEITYLIAAVILLLLALLFRNLAVMFSYAGFHDEDFKPVTPFTEDNLRHLHGMGRCLIALAVIFSGVPAAIGFTEGFKDGYANQSRPTRASGLIHIKIEDSLILVALLVLTTIVIFALARIFSYGIRLQREDDGLI